MKKGERVWDSFPSSKQMGDFRLLAKTEDMIILRVENETGEGDMIIYQVFDGVYLMYNDFHMEYYDSLFQAAKTILAVDFCREGSLVMECDNGFCQIKKPGNICIDSRVHHKGVVKFPTKHFHGITIGFESELATKALSGDVPAIPVDLEMIRSKFCGTDGYFMIQEEDTLKRLFMELYQVPDKAKQLYFRAKILELLVCLSVLEPGSLTGEKPYFYKEQVEKVHAAAKRMMENLKDDHRIEDLAKQYDISQTAFKECFKSIYRKPVFAWLTEQRMQRASELLTLNPEMSIGDIAFEVGYESGGKFAAAFKRIYGMSPKQYRSSTR
ncbi:MAG: AraC family transcriptional regulator [Peptostreptococcaceae bacterium]|nr:AraC family transcriptional regulator [Peptostreptococcaceae bacterium]